MNDYNSPWPKDVGITAIELYFPSQYVDQHELECFDKVSEGKYVIGLGQSKMGFCTDREDVNSLCLTVVDQLMKKNNIGYNEIGRLEVGTETIVDKSKSVKSVLMQLFNESGNSDVEGVDTTNACYGGTSALFNCINWIESSSWDGRYAMAVSADIAVYAKGNARCTGGAGAIAILIGPNAPIIFDRGLRSTHVQHVYDFYKPNLSSEYPIVDGKLSIACYLGALDKCYEKYKEKFSKCNPDSKPFTVDDADAFIFHSPYCKLVQKSFGRLVFNDVISNHVNYEELNCFKNVDLKDTYFDKDIEKAALSASSDLFIKKTKPSLLCAREVGNMYTPSVYSGLVSLLCSKSINELTGLKIVIFSYGSGLASSMFSLKIVDSVNNKLEKLLSGISDIKYRLETRNKVEPSVFDSIMKCREDNIHKAPFKPIGEVNNLLIGTWYLTNIDEKFRRNYDKITSENIKCQSKGDQYITNGNNVHT